MKIMGQTVATLALIFSGACVSLEVGDTAPEFTLQASDGNTYSLDQFKESRQLLLHGIPWLLPTAAPLNANP